MLSLRNRGKFSHISVSFPFIGDGFCVRYGYVVLEFLIDLTYSTEKLARRPRNRWLAFFNLRIKP